MTGGLGHNGGPTMEPGQSWRAYQWRKAQKALMPSTIPQIVLRMRMRRAAELGLDYRAYAAVRQATGRDICGLLFSSNALRIVAGDPAMPPERRAAVARIQAANRLVMVHRPLDPDAVASANPVDAAARAPDLRMSHSQTASALRAFVAQRRLAGDQVLIIGETMLEQEWLGAARAAGYLHATQYFGARSAT